MVLWKTCKRRNVLLSAGLLLGGVVLGLSQRTKAASASKDAPQRRIDSVIYDVVIVDAGVSGLTAARCLRLGVSPAGSR